MTSISSYRSHMRAYLQQQITQIEQHQDHQQQDLSHSLQKLAILSTGEEDQPQKKRIRRAPPFDHSSSAHSSASSSTSSSSSNDSVFITKASGLESGNWLKVNDDSRAVSHHRDKKHGVSRPARVDLLKSAVPSFSSSLDYGTPTLVEHIEPTRGRTAFPLAIRA